jgi:hypothetical protein
MLHQKGHEKRAGEAGGKARFEGRQRGGTGGRPLLAGAGRRGGIGGRISMPDRFGMTRNNVTRPASDRLTKAIDRLVICSSYVLYQEIRDGTH